MRKFDNEIIEYYEEKEAKGVKAKWSGSYPALCHGEWYLSVSGEDVSGFIPQELKNSPMWTAGTYYAWHFENWLEVFEPYEDGLDCDEWINENKDWLGRITTDSKTQKEIFYAIQEEDFRWGSCGGCV